MIDAIGPDLPGLHFVSPVSPPHQDDTPHPMQAAFDALTAYTGPTMRDPALLIRAARVHLPVQAIWGGKDTVATPEFGHGYAAAFPDSRYAFIEGAGHVPTREKPEEVFAVLDSFLQSL